MDTILRTENLCKYYGEGENQVKAVQNAEIEIKRGRNSLRLSENQAPVKARFYIFWAVWIIPHPEKYL